MTIAQIEIKLPSPRSGLIYGAYIVRMLRGFAECTNISGVHVDAISAATDLRSTQHDRSQERLFRAVGSYNYYRHIASLPPSHLPVETLRRRLTYTCVAKLRLKGHPSRSQINVGL